MKTLDEKRTGGFFLILGTVVFLVSVYFEYTIGWITLEGGPEDPYSFVASNWSALSGIWQWQMIGGICTLLAYLLFLKQSLGLKSVLWALLVIGGLMSTAAFMLTLGSYEPALAVYDTQPDLFEAIRGGIRVLYDNIMIGPFVLIFLFCLETFGKKGAVKKSWGIAALAFFILVTGIGAAVGIYIKVAGLAYFVLPIVLGYFYMRGRPEADAA